MFNVRAAETLILRTNSAKTAVLIDRPETSAESQAGSKHAIHADYQYR